MSQRPTLEHLTEAVSLPPAGRCVREGCYGECRESDSFCDPCLAELRSAA